MNLFAVQIVFNVRNEPGGNYGNSHEVVAGGSHNLKLGLEVVRAREKEAT